MVTDPSWADRTVYIVGGGPSLSGFDFNRLCGRGVVLGVNHGMFDAPCDAGTTVDHRFVKENFEDLRTFAAHKSLYLVISTKWREIGLPEIDRAIYLPHGSPGHVHRGMSSGYTALDLAMHFGAKKIVLLGFDYSEMNGKHHYHNFYQHYHRANVQSWPVWAKSYDTLARIAQEKQVEVINASPKSVLSFFRRTTIEEALNAF